jgi:hypothetical protein
VQFAIKKKAVKHAVFRGIMCAVTVIPRGWTV